MVRHLGKHVVINGIGPTADLITESASQITLKGKASKLGEKSGPEWHRG